MQKLNINLISNHSNANCVLLKITDLNSLSNVHVEDFRDSQEWYLYNYIGIEDCLKYKINYSNNEIENSLIRFHCAVARKPNYFYWNSFFIIFLLTTLSFNSFCFPYNLISNRLQITSSLILSSISFKFVINRNLPPIPYLTTVDIYSIHSILFLALLSTYHVLIVYFSQNSDLAPLIDRGFLIGITGFYFLYHLIYISFLYFRNFAPRRQYTILENQSKYSSR